jgi:hypothetical protein
VSAPALQVMAALRPKRPIPYTAASPAAAPTSAASAIRATRDARRGSVSDRIVISGDTSVVKQ